MRLGAYCTQRSCLPFLWFTTKLMCVVCCTGALGGGGAALSLQMQQLSTSQHIPAAMPPRVITCTSAVYGSGTATRALTPLCNFPSQLQSSNQSKSGVGMRLAGCRLEFMT